MLKVPPWAMPDAIDPGPLIVQQKVDLPAGTAFEIRVVLRSKDVKPLLYFQKNSDGKADPKLIGKYSLDQFVANNYLAIVAILWAIACILIFIAYKIAAAAQSSSDEKPQTIHLKIIKS